MVLFITLNSYALTPEITQHVEEVPENIECILAADIGGTESKVGIFEVKEDEPILLISMRTQTKNIGDSNDTMNEILEFIQKKYGITVQHACIAAPGVATKKKDFSNVHGMFDIKTSDLLEKTPLKTAIIVNDLFVVGHGLSSIAPENIIHLYGDIPEEEDKNHIRAIISAGSGIGSSTITWDNKKEQYITHAGEAGMLEFTPLNQLEYQLANHVKNFYGRRSATYWANIASGSGVTRVYSMLKLMGKYEDSLHLDDHDPEVILNHPEDELCKATTDLVLKLFTRFSRNYVWAVLPYGGLYIVGSLAAKNPELFAENFASYYEVPAFHKELKQIPIYLVKDPNVGLYGAANYLLMSLKEEDAS